MSDKNVIVYTTNRQYQAEILKNILADNGIHSFIINKQDSNYLFGDVEVYVNQDDVIKAKLLVEKFDKS